MSHSPEWHEKQAIKAYLMQYGLFIWYFCPMMNGFGKSGVPDILGCYFGKMFGIEVKRPGCKPTTIQKRRMEEIEAAGGKAFWGTAEKVIPEFEFWIGGK